MRRWPEEGATALEQELLDLLREDAPEPPAEAGAQVFAALSAQLGLGAAGGAAAGQAAQGTAAGATALSAAQGGSAVGAGAGAGTAAAGAGTLAGATSAGAGGVLKLALVGLLLGGATAGAVHYASAGFSAGEVPAEPPAAPASGLEKLPRGNELVRGGDAKVPSAEPQRTPRTGALQPGASAALEPGAAEAEPEPPGAVEEPGPAPGSSVARFRGVEAAPKPEPPTARRSQLEAENKALGEARRALQSGNAPRAMRLLTELNRRFPRLLLSQEHEAVSIRALAASGAQAEASARAERFVTLYPDSPLTPGVREILR